MIESSDLPRRARAPSAALIERRAAAARVDELAAAQHGVVSRRQMLHAGMSPAAIDRRLRSGWLTILHLGVYRVGPVVAPRSREMAAVLACRGDAIVSHLTASVLCELRAPARSDADVDVIPLGCDRGRRPGIRAHRVRPPVADEVTRIAGIPVTTPARTIVDLAAVLGARALERMMTHADCEGLVDADVVNKVASRSPHRRRSWRGGRGLVLRAGPQP